jgi:manganese/zinc/iron transport system substrate-binding protein
MIFDQSKTRRSDGFRGFRWGRDTAWLATLGAALTAVGAAVAVAADGPRVMATTTMAADIARSVGGDRCEVECLLAPGIDPHSYRATPRDADRLARAGVVVASGLRLEGRLSDLLERLGKKRTPVVSIGEGLPAPGVVAERLAALDPAGAEGYRARATERAQRLRQVHDEARRRLATVPGERRVLVTAHDAFRYFGRAYAVEVVGVQGTSTEAEAGLADINRLVDLLVGRRIPAVFVETSVSDRNVAALREGAGARGHAVTLGGRLYSDSLGGPGSGHETLEAALLANVDTIVAGLGGNGASANGGAAR